MIKKYILVGSFSLFGSFLNFIIQILLAKNYGLDHEVVAYFYALAIPVFISSSIAGVISHNVIPDLIRVDNKDLKNNYIKSLFMLISGISLFVTACGITFIYKLQILLLPKDKAILDYIGLIALLKISWIICGLQILLSTLIAIENAFNRYFFSIVLNIVPSIGALIVLSFLSEGRSIIIVFYGSLFGLIIAISIGFYKLDIYNLVSIRSKLMLDELKSLLIKTPYTVIALSCFTFYTIIDSYWGTRVDGVVLSEVAYSQRIIIALGTIMITGPLTLLPFKYAEILKNQGVNEFKIYVFKTFWLISIPIILLSIFMFSYSELIIKIILYRGAFDLKQISNIAGTVNVMLIGLLPMLLSSLGFRAIFCKINGAKSSIKIGLLWNGIYFLMSGLLYQYGSRGLALAFSISWVITFMLVINNIYKSKID
jgi:putative peptidoglycan lipid II flippase